MAPCAPATTAGAPAARRASRRSRARARGLAPTAPRAAVVGPGAVGAVATEPREAPLARGGGGGRRWPGTRREVRRRRRVVLAGMGVLSVAGVALAAGGLWAVRNSTVGRYEQALAPTDPGYQAYVVATPTMAAVQTGADGSLVGMAVLSLEPDDRGGSVIVVPPSTVVPAPPGTAPATLAELYRAGGVQSAVDGLGKAVTAAIGDYVVVDEAHWATLVAPVAPIEVSLDRPVADWPAGQVTLRAADIGRFLAAEAEGETDLDRLDRQEAFWRAWLHKVEDGGEDALPGEVDSGLGRFVRGVASRTTAVASLPVARDDSGGGLRLVPDAQRVGQLVARAVPFPTAPGPGTRISVRLLNGTGDADLTTTAVRALVAAGAQVTIVGNAPSFDVATTAIVYSGANKRLLAEYLGALASIADIEEVSGGDDTLASSSDDEIDVTVILGADARDLIGR